MSPRKADRMRVALPLSICVQPEAWRVALTIVGTLVGAGFASGREIAQFFAVFGSISLVGVILAAVLLGVATRLILDEAVKHQTSDHADLLRAVMPGQRRLTAIFDAAISLMLLGGMTVMMAGAAALLASMGLARPLGTAIVASLVFVSTYRASTQLMTLNSYLTPVLAAGILLIALLAIASPEKLKPLGIPFESYGWGDPLEDSTATPLLPHWTLAALLYLSFNLAGLVPVLAILGASVRVRRVIAQGSSTGALLFGLLVMAELLALLIVDGTAMKAELPMLSLALAAGPLGKAVFTITILLAMLTTAVADCHSLASRFSTRAAPRVAAPGWRAKSGAPSGQRTRATAVMVTAASLMSLPGFGNLVGTLYPVFGYVGLVLLATLLIQKLRVFRDK